MSKQRLDAHPSVVIAYSPKVEKLLMSVYDEGYPRKAYRLSANNIGGNPEPYDISPENTLIKEIAEEFNPNHQEEKQHVGRVLWANEEDIRSVRNNLVAKLMPLQDFLAVQKEIIDGGNKPYVAIYSAFYTEIPEQVINSIDIGLKNNQNFVTEGLIGVFSLNELEDNPRGEFSTAHLTAHILNWKFGSKILHPIQLTAEPLGMPRKSYESYLSDFEYDNENLRKASTANFG